VNIPRMKFSKPIRPGIPLVLEIKILATKDRLDFTYVDSSDGSSMSQGKIKRVDV
jgi:hypothetical protein